MKWCDLEEPSGLCAVDGYQLVELVDDSFRRFLGGDRRPLFELRTTGREAVALLKRRVAVQLIMKEGNLP